MTSSEEIIGGMPIEIIKKKNLKNLYVRVNPPEGTVTVSTPSDYPDEEIRLFVLKKMPEITKVRDRMLSQARQSEREYVSGESHYLWDNHIVFRWFMKETSMKFLNYQIRLF